MALQSIALTITPQGHSPLGGGIAFWEKALGYKVLKWKSKIEIGLSKRLWKATLDGLKCKVALRPKDRLLWQRLSWLEARTRPCPPIYFWCWKRKEKLLFSVFCFHILTIQLILRVNIKKRKKLYLVLFSHDSKALLEGNSVEKNN